MTLRDGQPLLEYHDLVGTGLLAPETYRQACSRGNVTVIQKGGNGRPALIDWTSLPERYKAMVIAHLGGHPEELAKARAIEEHLVLLHDDDRYLNEFKGDNGLRLTDAKRASLKKSARVMALLARMDELRKANGPAAVVKQYNMPILALKKAILRYIKLEKLDLPGSFARLEARKRAYLEVRLKGYPGAASLVHGNQGNHHTCKTAGADQAEVLRLLSARHQNFGLATIAKDYNAVATGRGWPAITAGTVKNFLRNGANGRAVTFYAKGRSAYQDNYGIINHREGPSNPGLLWVMDGKVYELLYQRQNVKEGKMKTGYWHRKVVVFVIDPYSYYPVGFAIGDRENDELNMAALKNAVEHMAELTGEYWLPWQLQSDRFSGDAAKALYSSVAKWYTPAAAYNARAKAIEAYFSRHDTAYVQRHQNYAGHNIDSRKENQPNPDAIERIKKDFPDEAGVIAQIIGNIQDERMDRRAEFLKGLEGCEPEARRICDRVTFLELFGTRHVLMNGSKGNELTNGGLQPTLLGQKRCYNILSNEFQDLVGTTFTITYDPNDLSNVLATADEGKYRFLVPQMVTIPMAIMDHTPETRALLAEREAFKKRLGTDAMQQLRTDADRLQYMAERVIQEAQPKKLKKAMRMTDEQEAVVRGRMMIGNSHKQALHEVATTGWTAEEIRQHEQDALDQL
jgi:hypothetical protein